MWFSEYVFLERSWAKDENTLKVRVYFNKKDPSCIRIISKEGGFIESMAFS